MKKITLIVAFIAALSVYLNAQNASSISTKDYSSYPYWIEMMQDPEANFFGTVEAFNIYWENREITKGSGYKPFKRWEYYWQNRVNADGTRKPADQTFNSYFEFLQKNNSRDGEFQGEWTNLGPIEKPGNAGTGQPNGNGRINDIAFHPTNSDMIYIGAPAGGLWMTDDGGQTWESFTDNLPTLGVSSIIVDYSNTSTIFIGTGDRDANDAPGMGVMKSIDGGVTFSSSNTGMGNQVVGRMIQHPDNPGTMLAASSGGMYKTVDAGQTWDNVRSGNFKDVVYKVDDPDIVFATANGTFYRSSDGGDSWSSISGTSGSRGVIGVSDADPNVVFFHTVSGSAYNATFRSVDAGLTFSQRANSPNIMSWYCSGGSGGQGWYDLDVVVDPNNADVLYSGGVNVWKSENGAASWDINSHWVGDCGVPAVHADCHSLEFNPLDGRLYAGNDGGIYWSDDGGITWNEITSGLAISQIYKIGQAKLNKDKVMNGYQDNGSATYLGEEEGFLTVMGGDGMDCAYDHKDDRYAYGEYYNGQGISRIFNNSNQGGIGGGISESGAWVTPFMLDVVDNKSMYVGMKNIWVSNNIRSGNPSWRKISNFSSSNQTVVEQSEANPNIFYSAVSNQSLYRSDDVLESAPGWTNLSSNLPTSGTPTDVEAHPFDENIVYITLNYKVYKSDDKGVTWENITLNLPSASTNTIEYYKLVEGGLYVGTDAGIYYKDDTMDEWILFSDGFAIASAVTEIEIYLDSTDRANDAVRASTYGRGLWSSPAFYAMPTANFEASETSIPVGCSIDFYDLSDGVPYEWEWTFENGIPATSNEQNPTNISFPEEGTYEVTLTVRNPAGEDTKSVMDYIVVDGALLPDVNFAASDTLICTSESIQMFDESEGCPTDWLWEFEPNNVVFVDGTDENSRNPVLEFPEGGSYNVTLTVSNLAGESSETKEDYISSGGLSIPFTEDFSGVSYGATGWSIENPDGKTSWELNTIQDDNGDISTSWMNFFNYTNLGSHDFLYSPLLNFQGFETVFMSFEYAYAQRYNQVDSLIVKISDDCGESWKRVYANGPDGEGIFETSEPTDIFFEPSNSEEWCGMGYGAVCPIIDVSEWAGKSNIQIVFETYNQYGNNLYLNNVEVSNTVGLFNSTETNKEVLIYPNPSNDYVYIKIENPSSQTVKINNIKGQTISSITIESVETKISLSDLPEGIYFIQVTDAISTTTKKLIIQ